MSATTDPRDVLRRALLEIRSLKERLAAAERAVPAQAEPVAVVGIGCRFPGGADSPAALWHMLNEGRDGVAPRPPGRWSDGAAPREGGFLPDVEGFDARFFGIAPREAAAMDPQHRLLLEVAWEALEHASIDPHALAGSRTGVFVGLATNDFARRVPESDVDRYFGVGSSPAVASGRLAYLLDLRGPCITLDTACSSSLVAVHYAMRALRDRDCDTALAAGVSLMLGPSLGESFVSAGMLAPDGRCKSFDARADGYGRAEGAGVVVLRRLSDALRGGDPVLAVLRASAINQDGRSAGLTAPNGPAQTALIRTALEAADLAPDDIDYIEAHGTGTPLGDPIEWHALAAAFAGRDRPLLVGSVKSNIGHAEAAAGIAGLIKAVLALSHGSVPPNLHFGRRNPAIANGATPIEVPVASWPGVRRAGVSAFGFSGTNAHVVLEAPPPREPPAVPGEGVLLLSAHDPAALREMTERYRRAFDAGLAFGAACRTVAVGRARLPWWIAVRSPEELAGAEPSDGTPPVLGPTAGPRIVLPTYPFQRERFPLPGAASSERTLGPDDPLLAGTEGLAHLGVLLALLDAPTEALANVTFPSPLVVATPRIVRVHRTDGRIALQSRMAAEAEWTTHLAAEVSTASELLDPPPEAFGGSFVPADALYARIAAAGFRYGPAARCLSAIAVRDGTVIGTVGAANDRRPGSHPTDGRPMSGQFTGGHPIGSHPTDGHPVGGQLTGGHPIGSHPTDGRPMGGQLTGGHPIGSHPTDGHPMGGQLTGGHPIGSHPTDGHPMGGQLTGGHPNGSHPTDGRPMSGQLTGGHPIGSHPTDGRPMGSQLTDGHPIGNHPIGSHSADSYPSVGHSTGSYPIVSSPGLARGPTPSGTDHPPATDIPLGNVSDDPVSPGTIEAAAQLAYAMLPDDAPPVMLAGADRLTRFTGGSPAIVWLRSLGASAEGGLRADFGLADRNGRPLLHIAGASFALLPDQSRRWSRAIVWQPVPLPAAAASADPFVWRAPDSDPAAACAAFLAVLPEIGERTLRIVTRGAQHVGVEAAAPHLGHAALWGMSLAVMAERPALRCRLIDLDPDLASEPPDAEFAADDEPAVAWRAGRRLARRLEQPPHPLPADEAAMLSAPGVLRWEPRPSVDPGPGMVRIGVVAAGLTFRDRLLFNGLAPVASPLGSDCAGIVEAVGSGVADFREGDRVIALAPEAIGDRVTVPAISAAPAPCVDLVAAATMPAPYLTALAGLPALGSRDCVLIHQAGSATGLAAAAVARQAGARVILTAGRQRHGWFAPEQVLDSRDPATWGKAVRDVTAAFGAFEPAHLAHLPGVPVVNLDKRAGWHFDLDRVDPARKHDLMARLGDLPPLPRRVVARTDLAAALAGEGPLVGRSVVLLREPPPVRIERGATYLVTGAAGGLGRMVAAWLAAAGAVLCLVDRAPVQAAPPHRAIQADAGDEAAMGALIDSAGPSHLRGVFHCAAIVDDDRLEQQTPERLAAVLRAKVDGALVLDRVTRSLRLDHFVLFSSVAGVMPSARQAGYAAANAVLDQIAQGRRQRGLPALSVNWGPWHAGIGRAMGARAAEAWHEFGVAPILPAAGLRALPAVLASPEAQVLVADIRWDRAKDPEAQPARPEPGPVTVERLQAVLAPLLGVRDPETLDADAPLLSFGLDSLTAVEFARALSREFGRPVAPDFVYNHPTLTRAAQVLGTRRPVQRAAGFLLRAPRWMDAAPGREAPRGWTVAGASGLARAVRDALPEDPANLIDLGALDVAPSGDPSAREALFPGVLERLRPRLGQPSQIVFAVPASGALAVAVEGFAAALSAEQPSWSVRTVRLATDPTDPLAALLRELAVDDGEERVRLSGQGRQAMRLVPLTARGAWQASPDASYLVTGGNGGIGALVAAHLVARGARHLVLAARRPVLPAALAGGPAEVRLHQVDLGDAAGVAGLFSALRAAGPPLRGIFHAAGTTADGTIAAGWDRIGRGFPAKADGARLLDAASRDLGLSEFVLFSSITGWFGLPGTSGYAAANGFLDGLAEERRAAGLPAVSIAWCAWQGVGMAADPGLWQDGRVPSLRPDVALAALDAALASGETVTAVTEPGWHPNRGSRLLEQAGAAAAGVGT